MPLPLLGERAACIACIMRDAGRDEYGLALVVSVLLSATDEEIFILTTAYVLLLSLLHRKILLLLLHAILRD